LSKGLERVPVSVWEPSLEFHTLEEFTYIPQSRVSTLASNHLNKVKMDFPRSCVGCSRCSLRHGCSCGVQTLVDSPYTTRGRLRSSLLYQPVSVANLLVEAFFLILVFL
jgi:hypothetical protein